MFISYKELIEVILIGHVFTLAVCQKIFDEKLYENVLNSTLCKLHLQEWNMFEFLDAGLRLPQSIKLGSQGSLGNYYQCLSIHQFRSHSVIDGKYCMVQIPYSDISNVLAVNTRNMIKRRDDENAIKEYYRLKRVAGFMMGLPEDDNFAKNLERALGIETPMDTPKLRFAICIPRSCSTQEVGGGILDQLNITYVEKFCRLPNDKLFSIADWVAVGVITLIFLLTFLSTTFDFYIQLSEVKGLTNTDRLLISFSIYNNTKRLFTFRDSPVSIECIDGIRAISILWVIVGHSFSNFFIGTVINPLDALKWMMSSASLWLTSANLSVDTFFMLSGVLVVYTTAAKISKGGLLKNLHLFYLHRLLRMFPLLAAAVLLQASLFHHLSDGPNWTNLTSSVQMCRRWWWSALLHVQNYLNFQEICLPHSWFLSVDTQLHLLSPLILIWLLHSKRSAYTALTLSMLIVLSISLIYSFVFDFNGLSFIGMMKDYPNSFQMYYVNTLTRSSAFVVGMIFGFLLHCCREKRIHLRDWQVALAWTCTTIIGGGMIYLNNSTLELDQFWINIFTATMRPLWCTFIGWLIFACAHGYGGPINWFLSLRVWRFLARVSYTLYLFHYPLQFMLRASAELPAYFSISNVLKTFVVDLTYTLMFSIVMCVLVDAPFTTVLKFIMASGNKGDKVITKQTSKL